ncbi:MAG: hypothetical protein LBJ11_11510 [Oscillospiraceae bacterium]|jgi:hypothetical protein|nr:hypothetical protein [Oscillospiraceae bacterium]
MAKETGGRKEAGKEILDILKGVDGSYLEFRSHKEELYDSKKILAQSDQAINELIDTYTSDFGRKSVSKHKLKKIFFGIVMGLLILLVLFPVAVIMGLILKKNTDGTLFKVIIAGFGEILATMIVIPRMIAKYLFDPEEEEHHISLIKSVLEYNKSRHQDSNGR